MNHQHANKNNATSTVATSISSILFSIVAATHHWLHTGILLILGSSTNMMAAMSGIVWLRRGMILLTTITTIYSIFRLKKHKHMPTWMRFVTVLSIFISFSIIIYTLINGGW